MFRLDCFAGMVGAAGGLIAVDAAGVNKLDKPER